MTAALILELTTQPEQLKGTVALLVVAVIIGSFFALLALWVLRRYYRPPRDAAAAEEIAAAHPRAENSAAFMAASMQGVIQRLREQEKELERLHKRERERAQQTERLSEAVTRNMPTGLLLVNAAGLITLANPAAEAALGVRALGYRRYSEVLGPDSALTRLLAACITEGHTFRREEVEHTTPAGETRQLGATISPTLPAPAPGATPAGREARKVAGALVLLSDLTELTALQRQMRMRENLAALGEMAAGIAHEFKNALATIAGYAQMVRGEDNPAEISESAEKILQQTRALAQVVTEFLRFARPLEYEPEEVDLGPLVGRVAAEIREAVPGVPIAVEGEFAEVSGDEALLRQALLNLVRNAAEAVTGREGGHVVVRGLHGSGPASGQLVMVADNGPGIPAGELDKIFLPFHTTKAEGTGLGLAIVQKIVLQHGGTVEARNLPEGGAAFLLTLPIRRTVPARTIEPAATRI